MDRALFFMLLLVLFVSAQEPAEELKCHATHSLVGKRFALSTDAHSVSGDVVIKSDCEFDIEHFFYDGRGPDVYVYGFSKEIRGRRNDGDVDLMAYEMLALPKGEAYSGRTLPVMLPETVHWDNITVISIWCKRFGVDFGSAVLRVQDE